MALQFKITKDDFDALDESLQGFYKEDGEGYRLDVEGTDDAKEVREALRKEREEKAAAKARAKELEDAQAEAERQRLEKQQEWEQLSKTERERADRTEKELAELRDKVANGERTVTAEGIVAALIDKEATGGVQRYSLLKKEAMQYIAHTPEGVKINGPDGEAWDSKALGKYLSEQYPFLVDGSKASGGGAPGNNGGGAARKKLSEMNDSERLQFKQEDPEGFRKALHAR